MVTCLPPETPGAEINKWRTGSVFVIGQLTPMALLAEMVAMVPPEANDCVVRNIALLQRTYQQANLCVDVRHASRVAVNEFSL